MKRTLLLLLLSILSLYCHSQITFEKGYFINNNNQKIDCLIKNLEWNNNPRKFEYILSKDGEPQVASIASVKEFKIENGIKYIRRTVNIDRSSESINRLNNDRKPVFKEEELFLKVLVEGKSNLYEYVDMGLVRYFYKREKAEIEQLIFKRYKTNEDFIRKNNRFRQQLWVDLECENLKLGKIENLDYTNKDLVRFFTKYSEIHNVDIKYLAPKQEREFFNLTIRPRINVSSLAVKYNEVNSIQNPIHNEKIDFGNGLVFGLGLEAEFILPFNKISVADKNNWAIIVEPSFQHFKSEKTVNQSNVAEEMHTAKVNHKIIETAIGLRHYFLLGEHSKIFVDASLLFDFSPKASIDFIRSDGLIARSIQFQGTGVLASNKIAIGRLFNNFAIGIGYKQNDKISLGLRYQKRIEQLITFSNTDLPLTWSSDFQTLSLVFGYTLF